MVSCILGYSEFLCGSFFFPLGHREFCLDSENHSPDVADVWNRPGRDRAAQWRPVHQRPAHSTHRQTRQPQGDLVQITNKMQTLISSFPTAKLEKDKPIYIFLFWWLFYFSQIFLSFPLFFSFLYKSGYLHYILNFPSHFNLVLFWAPPRCFPRFTLL